MRLFLRTLEEHFRQHDPEKPCLIKLIIRVGDDAESGDHVTHHGVFSQGPLVGQTTWDSGGKKTALRGSAHVVFPIEKRELSPRQVMLIPIAPNVVDDPGDFIVFGCESQRRDGKGRRMNRLRVFSVLKDRRVQGDEPTRQLDDLGRAAPVLAQLRRGGNFEVVRKIAKHAGISASPGIDRLLVVSDCKDVLVFAGKRVDDSILDWIQVLEFIDEDSGPALTNLPSG